MPIIARHGTWLQDEFFAYPNGAQRRKGEAIFPDRVKRRIWAGTPDSYFTIPAHGRLHGIYLAGYVTTDDALVTCPACKGGDWRDCPDCSFGLVDSPTYGALLFRPTIESIRHYNGWVHKTKGEEATLADYLVS